MEERRSKFGHSRLILAGLVLFLALQSILAFRLNINWDEYFFLSHIHTFLGERPLDPMQTFHVRLLAWLPSLPFNDPDQIVAGRLIMMFCQLGALFCVYRIAMQLASAQAALVAVVAWCGAGFALTQGFSFRTDPLAGFCIMVSLALLFSKGMSWVRAAFAGIMAAIALLVTIKSAIFLPCFLAALIWQTRGPNNLASVLAKFALAAIVLAISGLTLWLWHSSSLSPFPVEVAAKTTATTKAAANSVSIFERVFLSQSILPRWDYISRWLLLSIFALIPIAVGVGSALRKFAHADRSHVIVLLLLASPLIVLLLYRNAFSYFFPFMMLPVSVLAAIGWDAMDKRIWKLATLGGMAAIVVGQFIQAIPQDQSTQREIAQVAQRMFPDGTRYLDRNGMLPSFQKSGYFMSSWGIEGMVGRGQPALANVIDREGPPLVVSNTPILSAALDPYFEWPHIRLTDQEERAMRESYIPHWGQIWIAGKEIGEATDRFEMRIGGSYTLECEGRRELNGRQVPCGAVVELSKGEQSWSGGSATLRWGDNIYRPSTSAPTRPIYYGF